MASRDVVILASVAWQGLAENTHMHYVIVAGIFGLPFVVCAAVLVAKVLDAFTPEERRTSRRNDKSGAHDRESRVDDLIDSFLAAPAKPAPKL